jgi:predicted nucleic acid-binding protein
MRLYLDANAIIYSVEGLPGFRAGVSRWIEQAEAAAALLITSRLSLLECRVGPLRQGDQGALARYDAFFSGDNLAVFDISSDVIDRATDMRVRYGFRSPDAIHLATAILLDADVFLTGDGRLDRCTEVRVVVIKAEPTTE